MPSIRVPAIQSVLLPLTRSSEGWSACHTPTPAGVAVNASGSGKLGTELSPLDCAPQYVQPRPDHQRLLTAGTPLLKRGTAAPYTGEPSAAQLLTCEGLAQPASAGLLAGRPSR